MTIPNATDPRALAAWAARLTGYELRLFPAKAAWDSSITWYPDTGTADICIGGSGRTTTWTFLHEIGHLLYGKHPSEGNCTLRQAEVGAWAQAVKLGQSLGLPDTLGVRMLVRSCIRTYYR